jgi:hypothetical protein
MHAQSHQALQEQDRVNRGRLDLLGELHVALAPHLNNIMTSLGLNVSIIEARSGALKTDGNFIQIRHALAQVEKILDGLRPSADADSIHLEQYVAETRMLKLDRE